MTFFDLIKEISKKYSRVIEDFLYQFIYDSNYEEKDFNYYEKLIKKLDEDISRLKKEIREKERLKKEICDKIKEKKESYKEENYEYSYRGYEEKNSYRNDSYDNNIARYYAMLELKNGSGIEEVKAAYRRLMKKYHPDFFSNDPEKQRIAKEVAQGLTRAYEELLKHLKGK